MNTTTLIESATGIIRTPYTGSDITDPDMHSGNGTDDGSNIVADGTYQVNVTMDDGVVDSLMPRILQSMYSARGDDRHHLIFYL